MLRSAGRNWRGQVIVVTGAGSGIGRATASLAAFRGASLVLVGRRKGALEQTAEHCRRSDVAVEIIAADVTAEESPELVVDAALRRFGRIDGLVNNAAIARFGTIERLRDEDFRAMFETNLLAPVRLIRAALEALRQARGAVVNVSSIGGVVATPRRAAYGALKAALNHLTRSLARELAPLVRVNALVPGAVDTPMHDDLGLEASDWQRLRAEMMQSTPAGRMGQPDEVARWICELLDAGNGWMTGSLVTVDGGRSA